MTKASSFHDRQMFYTICSAVVIEWSLYSCLLFFFFLLKLFDFVVTPKQSFFHCKSPLCYWRQAVPQTTVCLHGLVAGGGRAWRACYMAGVVPVRVCSCNSSSSSKGSSMQGCGAGSILVFGQDTHLYARTHAGNTAGVQRTASHRATIHSNFCQNIISSAL